MLLPALARAKQKAQRINCVNNLKQVGTAYRLWANDNGDRYPLTRKPPPWVAGRTLVNSGIAADPYLFYNYTILQNELGESAKIVLCPADDRIPNTNFYSSSADSPSPTTLYPAQPAKGTFCNTNVSYWVGPGASDSYPQAILGGDRNLGCIGAPPRPPAPARTLNYGFFTRGGEPALAQM